MGYFLDWILQVQEGQRAPVAPQRMRDVFSLPGVEEIDDIRLETPQIRRVERPRGRGLVVACQRQFMEEQVRLRASVGPRPGATPVQDMDAMAAPRQLCRHLVHAPLYPPQHRRHKRSNIDDGHGLLPGMHGARTAPPRSSRR